MDTLTYAPLDISHADGLFSMWSDEDVIRFTNIRRPQTMDEVTSRIRRLKAHDVFAVIADGAVVGIVGCPCVNKTAGQYGLFYQFRKSAWGRGNASAAAGWMLRYMGRKYGAAVLFADVIPENAASEKILRNCGFELISEEILERDGAGIKVHNYRRTLGEK